MTHFIKITDKNLEFYLKKKEVSVIVLESDKKEVTILSTANGKFTAAVSLDPIELKALYNSYINQLDSDELPHKYLIKNLSSILESNNIDTIMVLF